LIQSPAALEKSKRAKQRQAVGRAPIGFDPTTGFKASSQTIDWLNSSGRLLFPTNQSRFLAPIAI